MSKITSNGRDDKYNNVIVFGTTGDVGSVAALEANKQGANVWLATEMHLRPSVALVKAESSKIPSVVSRPTCQFLRL